MFKDYISEWKNYFDFKGRVRRRYLWRFLGINSLFSLLFICADVAYTFMSGAGVTPELASQFSSSKLISLSTIFAIASFIPTLKVIVKRFHDLDKTGWFVLIGLIPILGHLYVSIVTLFFSGTEGENRFGNDPKDPDQSVSNVPQNDFEDKRSFDHRRLDIVRKVFDSNINKGVSVKKISKVLENRGYEKDEILEGLDHYKKGA